MSEGESSPLVPQDQVVSTGGAILRKAREAQGLHVAALAVSLKVPVRKLEALEADRLDLLPDTVFARALASSVCRALKIDSGPVLAGLPLNAGKRQQPEVEGMNVPFRASRDGMGLSLSEQLFRPMTVAILVLVLGAFVMVLYPFGRVGDPLPEIQPEQASAPVAPAPTPDQSPSKQMPVASDAGVTTTVGPSGIVATIPAPTVAAAPAQTASMPSALAQVTDDPRVSNASLSLKARSPSWVEAVDARGRVLLRRTLTPGETASVSGVAPLSVVVGKSDAVDVQANGIVLNLVPLTKDNVARFEVKQ